MRRWPYAIKDVIWRLVLNARGKDGGKREEQSCGADTGVQRCSLTRWFLLVGVRSVGQLRGALTYTCKQRKDFRFYCFLSGDHRVVFKTLFCPTALWGGTAVWW